MNINPLNMLNMKAFPGAGGNPLAGGSVAGNFELKQLTPEQLNALGMKPVQPVDTTALPRPAGDAVAAPESFQSVLQNSLNKISELNENAENAMHKLATGEIQDVHQVMIAMEKANLTFQTMMQVRNKLLQAYNEMMKMQF